VNVWRREDIQTQAKSYVKSYILFPSGVLGLLCMLVGVGGLGYQFLQGSTYTWTTFTASSGLLILGGLCGWAQTRYHRYLLQALPEVFAARIRMAVQRPGKKSKVDPESTTIHHPGRQFVPLAYLGVVVFLISGSAWALLQGSVDPLPAILLPWAGFYWGKLFFWRGIVQ
jgi:hypothetical protein